MNKQSNKQTYKQTKKHTNKKTKLVDEQTDKKTNEQTEKQTNKQTDEQRNKVKTLIAHRTVRRYGKTPRHYVDVAFLRPAHEVSSTLAYWKSLTRPSS